MGTKRQILTNGTSKDRGTRLTDEELKKLFPTRLYEDGYNFVRDNTKSTSQSINLEIKTLWGFLNKKTTKINKDGNPVPSASVYEKDKNEISLTLPVNAFGTAVSGNQSYNSKDSLGRASYADSIFNDRTTLTGIYAEVKERMGVIRKLVQDKAMNLGLIAINYDPIDMNDVNIQDYFKAEILPKYNDLMDKYSLYALTKPGQIFEGASIFMSINSAGFKTYTLYLT